MANAEFFNHQLGERIRAEGAAERQAGERRAFRFSWSWSMPRLAGLAAGCAFVLAALYYGLVPPHLAEPERNVVKEVRPVRPAEPLPPAVAENSPAPAALPPSVPAWAPAAVPRPSDGPLELVAAYRAYTKSHVPDAATSATTMQFKGPHRDKNVNVLWLNGLPYVPDDVEPTPGAGPSAPAPSP